MTSAALDRLVDELLRAPRHARWATLTNFSAFDRPLVLNELVDRFARSEELRNGYLRDLGDTTRACDSLKRELADTQRSLKAANGLTDEVRIRLHEVQSDAVRERANTNNLGISLTRLQLQANGWKEENEQLRKERDQLRKEVNEMENCANKVGYDNKQLKEELDLLNRNHAKLLAVRDEQLARSVAALESVRVSRFWKLVTELGLTPKHAKSVISEAEEIVKDLGKPA